MNLSEVNPCLLSSHRCCICNCTENYELNAIPFNSIFVGFPHCENHELCALLCCLVLYHQEKRVRTCAFLQKFPLLNKPLTLKQNEGLLGCITSYNAGNFFFVRYSISNESWILNVSFYAEDDKDVHKKIISTKNIKLSDLIFSGIEKSYIDIMIDFLEEGFYSEIIELLTAQLDVDIV